MEKPKFDLFKNCESMGDVFQAFSYPLYPHRYSGPCIIAGSALCVHDDIKRALELRPGAPIIAVNRSAIAFDSLFMVAVDYKVSAPWKEEAEQKWGKKVEHHAGKPLGPGWPKGHEHVDYWWPRMQGGGGSSAWVACKIALNLGFTEPIICGAPLEPMKYWDGSTGWSDRSWQQMESFRKVWERDKFLHPYLKAMSGYGKELFGEPIPDPS